ncbi:MAG: sodium:proton antiporter [Clostridiales bacterium]|nr:sodium:proton antiporter [Clostridiales bacterium]
MTLVQNFPFFCIILSMFSAIISFPMNHRWAMRVHLIMVTVVLALSLCVLGYTASTGESYTFMMGHFPAPWGNEIRVGVLEALMAVFFSLIMLLSVLGGLAHIGRELKNSRKNLFFILLDLLMSSLLALIYTNDLFTAYVFIEINTISACGLIMIKKEGRTYVSALRYMVMSLVGSSLFLIALTLLYTITGQLLMTPAKEALAELVAAGEYEVPILVIISLVTVGLGIKSGLYPFHTWIPDAYGYTTPSASAILSSLVSKGYLFLLIKIFYRVLDFEFVVSSQVVNLLFMLGILGMIMGSWLAIKTQNIRRMAAFSSVAQIGYIYMGIGLGTTAGVVAALFHIISHGAMKSLLFISISGLSEVSDDKSGFESLKGAGFRNKLAGVAYTVGAMSMIGMPLLTGFISKYMFASAATTAMQGKMVIAWIALAISTILNTVYFMGSVLTIYHSVPAEQRKPHGMMPSRVESVGTVGLIALNVGLGVAATPVIQAIQTGLAIFG